MSLFISVVYGQRKFSMVINYTESGLSMLFFLIAPYWGVLQSSATVKNYNTVGNTDKSSKDTEKYLLPPKNICEHFC